MKIGILSVIAAISVFSARAAEMTVSADSIKASRETGELRAEGNVRASLPPVSLLSQLVTKSADGVYEFDKSTEVTTCTNAVGHRHWFARGHVEYREGESVWMSNGWLAAMEFPLLWLPFWYYPIDTNYGWRVMPGYADRNGAMLFTRYIYHLAGSFRPGEYGLAGSTRLDLRWKNGVAVGQDFNWQLGDFGSGRVRGFFAWDEDYDRYSAYWSNSSRYNYRNWGSDVDYHRWALELEHQGDLTERDRFRVNVASFSDSYVQYDLLYPRGFMMDRRKYYFDARNEIALEHVENRFGFGLSVAGPIDEFSAGVGRLPEFYFDIIPQSLFGLPVNYESRTKVGYYAREAGEYGDSTTDDYYRYTPGKWANFNTFRFDTYHRLTLPMKFADVLSVVPRFGYHGTFWGDSAYTLTTGSGTAGETGHSIWRSIIEGGVTFAARGTADFDGGLRHVTEPYLDVLCQEACYAGLVNGARPYVFDSVDASGDFLDQFAGRSRQLPYSYYGLTPGWRNVWRMTDEKGVSRQLLELDVYASVQLNGTDWTAGSEAHRLSADPWKPNWGGKREGTVVPGVRFKWNPADSLSLFGRAEWDGENDELAYANLSLQHQVCDSFSWYVRYNGRDHRIWDYASSPDPETTRRRDGMNFIYDKLGEVGFSHDICDWLAWGPFVEWDFEENELSQIGGWIEYRLDCLAFRLMVDYETEYELMDGSETDDDLSVGFYIYLRALGDRNGNPFMH